MAPVDATRDFTYFSPNEQCGGGGGMLPDFFFCPLFPVQQTTSGIGQCVCVCVFFPFILDINGRTSQGLTGGRSHRISHPPSFCGACLNFSREKDSAIPFPRRP